MIRRLLIANRGEIALRVIRACEELGVESVAVYSTADAHAPHVRAATTSVAIGPAAARESYLLVERIVEAAREAGADAVHPGYGFLAERAELAEACRDAGLRFVGPSPEAIARMGSKVEARALMEANGVPVVPGVTPDDQSTPGLRRAVEAVGYPALLKASAGGGGKGMRVVGRGDAVDELIDAARRESGAAFGDGRLYVERFLDRPRHVEIQVLGDDHGRLVHLFERECSVQRRHQKIVEESPSPAVTPALRARMTRAALDAAAAVGYRNAGTVEFLVEGAGDDARFFFLEMNTRLQVEHPVTEAVTGTDLVRAQILVASGEPLPWAQADLTLRGHAIQCRVYAERPRDFLPQAGRIARYEEPTGPGLRVDAGVVLGSVVPVEYDPLLSKVVATAENRPLTIARARAALRRYIIHGVATNIGLLEGILAHPRFQDGALHTGLLEEIHAELLAATDQRSLPPALVAAVVALSAQSGHASPGPAGTAAPDPWTTLTGWRG